MKVSQLFLGVAAAALIAGSASAQQLSATIGGVTSRTGVEGQSVAPAAANNTATASRLFIASEVNTTGAAGVGTLSGYLRADTAADWNGAGAARVTISVLGAVFNAPVGAGSLVCPVGGNVTVFSGGNAGDSTVTFQVADLAACTTAAAGAESALDQLTFDSIAVALGSGTVNVTASVTRVATGLALGETRSTYGTAGAFIQRPSGIRVARAALNTAVPTATAALPGYTTLGALGGPNVNIRVGRGLVGTGAGTEITVRKNMAGDTFVHTDINGVIPVVITVPTPAGLNVTTATGATLNGALANTSAAGVLTYNVTSFAAMAANGGADLAFVIAPSTPAAAISAQTITASGSVALATGVAPTQTTAFAQPAFNLLTIARAGSNSNTMRWVGDGVTTSAISVFRMTGVPATVPAMRFTLSNATNGASFNGDYVIPASAITRSSGGEVVISSLTLQATAGSFGRADVVLTVEGNGIRTQRFVQAPNGTLAPAPEEATAT